MKRWFLFFVGVGLTSWLLYFAIRKNLDVIRREKADERTSVAALSGGNSVVPEPIPSPSAAGIQEEAVKRAGTVSEGKEPTFIEGSFQVIKLYRQGNQKFLREHIVKSQSIFGRALEGASALKPVSPEETQIQKHLVEASRARLESIRFFTRVLQSPDSSRVETWWEKNIALLKQANSSITQAIRLLGQDIQAGENTFGNEQSAELLLAHLQESAKGILVVTKAAHS